MGISINDLFKSTGRFIRGRVPAQAVIQMTDFCNAKCPQCGMRVQEKFPRHRLDEARLMNMIDSAAKNSVNAISFTGGEPFLHTDTLISCINRASEKGIKFIRTGTNAYFLTGHDRFDFKYKVNRLAEKIAATKLYTLWFSLDTWNADLHEENRGLKGVVKGMEKALPIFAEHGIYPSANLGINRHAAGRSLPHISCADSADEFKASFKLGFRKFYAFAESLGFTIVNACYPMSADNGSVYKAESADRIVKFTHAEKTAIFTALWEVIPEYRSRLRIFTPRSSLFSLIREYGGKTETAYPCRGGTDFFYIDSRNGYTHPCGFREGEDMGLFENLKPENLDRKAHCLKCDWECFRDPSTLFGPVSELFSNPPKLVKRISQNREFFKLWYNDVKYYKACNFFNGRETCDFDKMKAFGN